MYIRTVNPICVQAPSSLGARRQYTACSNRVLYGPYGLRLQHSVQFAECSNVTPLRVKVPVTPVVSKKAPSDRINKI